MRAAPGPLPRRAKGEKHASKSIHRNFCFTFACGARPARRQRATLPKIASNNRTKGTPQEDHAVVEGSINHFGRYTVDDKKKTVTFHIEGSTFPNWIGTTQERPYTITGDVLVYKVAVVSGTGQPGETGWKRAKK